MSCAGGLRALSSSRQASQRLPLSSRHLLNASGPRRAPLCTQRRLQCSILSPSLPATSKRPLAWSRHHIQQHVRFKSQVAGQKKRRAYVALGSNMGDRVAMIEKACKEMEASGKIKVLRTSSLWETKAMYVVDQDMFVNGACEVRPTSLQHNRGILTHAD
jgi:2-amino-4-hydroxy-6-hydroxymethyldihydropteridine diphosphokinase/dihydropteroate synthase